MESLQKELPVAIAKNILFASVQRSINYFQEIRASVNPDSTEFKEYGRKISAYIKAKDLVNRI